MGAILNMDDSTFSMMFLISLSYFCSSRLAERRMNCSPASFFMSEFTFTFDISCMIASSSSLSQKSTGGYRGLSSFVSDCVQRAISAAMISAALGLSILRMKMSRAMFLLGRGTSLLKRSPRTDLLWNWAQNLLVSCILLQNGIQITFPSAVTNTSLSSSLNYPIRRYSSTTDGSSCDQEYPPGTLVIFSTTMQMLLADWTASMQLGWTWYLFSERRLLQGTKVSCCMFFFSIMRTVTSKPVVRRPSSKCISLKFTIVSPRTQSLICFPLCEFCIICSDFIDIYIVQRMNNRPYDEMVKYILIGDSNVGKTSILRQFCQHKFNGKEQSTIGLDYGERIINISDKNVMIQLWDTAGQQRFRSLTPSYYRSAMGILLVYSVTDKSSFNSIEVWMKQIKQFAVDNIPILILCNKADVKEKQVSQHQSRALAERHHVDLLMTSARDNVNIETAMVRLYHRIDKEKRITASVTSITHTIKKLTEESTSKQSCKC